jgi:hypothetical protein
VDVMIAETELFAGNAVPTDQWIARTGEIASEHGVCMSYCFGCKQTVQQFNDTVVNCEPESTTVIREREVNVNQINYRGHVSMDEQGECTVVATGGGRWAGLYHSIGNMNEWADYSAGAVNPAAFNLNP